ncbi:MAG: ribosome-associated translation inhibitor RaiA [Hyphomonadaceae bacterium]|nr:ribosome-associated translation inhibitor RaiA [Clostridia bacterium]
MKFIIKGRKIEITDGLKERIETKIGKMKKFFDAGTEVYVTLKVEKDRHEVEVTIPFQGIILRAEEISNDMYHSIDRVVDALERQVRKYKTKLGKKIKEGAFKEYEQPQFDAVLEEDEFEVVRTKSVVLKPMTPEEAILQMNLLGHAFYVFTNAENERMNVVYKRKDGRYGLILQN